MTRAEGTAQIFYIALAMSAVEPRKPLAELTEDEFLTDLVRLAYIPLRRVVANVCLAHFDIGDVARSRSMPFILCDHNT